MTKRYRLIARDGDVWLAGTRIVAGPDGRINPHLLMSLDIFISGHVRHCSECRSPFIGNAGARYCSEECVITVRKRQKVRANRTRRQVLRAAVLADLTARCIICDDVIHSAERSSRKFCSPRCRQANHRKRATLPRLDQKQNFALDSRRS